MDQIMIGGKFTKADLSLYLTDRVLECKTASYLTRIELKMGDSWQVMNHENKLFGISC